MERPYTEATEMEKRIEIKKNHKKQIDRVETRRWRGMHKAAFMFFTCLAEYVMVPLATLEAAWGRRPLVLLRALLYLSFIRLVAFHFVSQ